MSTSRAYILAAHRRRLLAEKETWSTPREVVVPNYTVAAHRRRLLAEKETWSTPRLVVVPNPRQQSCVKIGVGNGASRGLLDSKQLLVVKKETTSLSREVFRLKVIYNDGGITVDVGANQTLTHVMGIVCSKWLNILRDGDGSIDFYIWEVRGPPLAEPKYLDSNESKDREKAEACREAYYKWNDSKRPIPAKEKLENITGLDRGRSLTIEYDLKHTTKFEIQLVLKYNAKSGSRFPKLVPSAADELSKSFRLYKPPPFCSNLNDIFPHANKAMFHCGERWICPYPSSSFNGGFIGGEFKRHFDVLFLPCKCSCLYEALVVMDRTMKMYPEIVGVYSENNSRLAFPVKLTKAKEAKFAAYMKEPGSKTALDDLIPSKKFNTVVYSQGKIVLRIKEAHMEKYTNIMDSMFPNCSKNYGKGRWASYRNGKVIIGEGNDKGGEERGVPKNIYAEVSYKCRSLLEFFCVCEALFQQTEANELERSLMALRI